MNCVRDYEFDLEEGKFNMNVITQPGECMLN